MKILQNVGYKIAILLSGLSLSTTVVAAAGSIETKINGYNEKVSVWDSPDPNNGNSVIMAAYGTTNPTIAALTDPTLVHAYNPILEISRSNSAITTAAAVWKAYDLIGGFDIIQVTVAGTSGWTINSTQTLSNSTIEAPLNNYNVRISDDGSTISVSWTSYIISSGNFVIRSVTSTDGGATWSTPSNL